MSQEDSASSFVNNAGNDANDDYTDQQLRIIAAFVRAAGAIGLLSSVTMMLLSWRDRDRIFHRLMLGLSTHMVLFSLWHLVGPAMVPTGSVNSWGAVGTTATCTAQGFGLQIAFSAPLYYVGLSFYSFLAVRHNFHVRRYQWIETYIHIGVHIFPLASAFYLLSVDGFNNYGNGTLCWIASLQHNCGDYSDDDLECVRGPQNIAVLGVVFALLPGIFILLCPTVVMVALYYHVKCKQQSIALPAELVAKQAALYLLAVWWSGMFSMAANALEFVTNQTYFVTSLLASFNLNLLSFWILLVYLKFRMPSSVTAVVGVNAPHQPPANVENRQVQQQQQQHDDAQVQECPQPAKQEKKFVEKYTFNIFDGTNADSTSDFAQFIFEGGSEELQADLRESQYWSAIQNHV